MLILNRMKLDGVLWMELGTLFVFFTLPPLLDESNMFNPVLSFGWEPDSGGIRGHVFATSDNSTVVVSIKGTSAAVFGGGGPTAKKNKFNDNLLFSCCCARIDWTWTTVCGCYRGGWKCHQNCLEAHYWESVLPNWHCSYSRSLNLVDNNTHWCTDRIYAIIWPTCSKHSSTSWAVIITLISIFLALILISGLLDILYAGHWPANIISRISTAVQIVWRSQLTAFLVHGSLSSVDPLSDADFTLSKGSIPSCVSAQTRESIAYIGRAIAIVKGAKGQKQPSRDLAKEHTIMLEDVMPEDQHAFDLVISQIRTNVGEWLWLNVLTKKESVRCRRCYQRVVR